MKQFGKDVVVWILQSKFPAFSERLDSALDDAARRYNADWTDNRVIDRVRRDFHLRLSNIWPDAEERDTIVAELAAKFQNATPADRSREIWRRFVSEIEAEKFRLIAMSESELEKLFWSSDTTDRETGHYDAQSGDFDEGDEDEHVPHVANLEPWFTKDMWYPTEAAFLVNGLEPVLTPNTKSHVKLPASVRDAEDRINRAIEKGKLTLPLSPEDVIRWANERLNLPEPVLAYAALGPAFANTRETTADLEKVVQLLTAENELLKRNADDEEVKPRSLKIFQRLLLTMAVEKYRFRPRVTHTRTIASIEEATKRLGLKVSNNKIREYIEDASEAFDDELTAYFSQGDNH